MASSSGIKRSYKKAFNFLKYGFTNFLDGNVEKLTCVICYNVFQAENMTPEILKEHLEKEHKEHANKDIRFFKRKEKTLKCSHSEATENKQTTNNIQMTENIQKQNDLTLQVSYQISYRIAMNTKSTSIGQDFIKPCLGDAVSLLIGEQYVAKIEQIPLSDTIVQSRISDLSGDIFATVVSEMKESPMFALQLDESTCIAPGLNYVIVFTRYIKDDDVKEEYLFCKSLPITTCAADVFQTLKQFVEEHGLDWSKLVGICTDGASSVLGIRSGFPALVKQVAPQVLTYHCLINFYALAVLTLPPDLLTTLNDVAKLVYIIFRGDGFTITRLYEVLSNEIDAKYNFVLRYNAGVRWLMKTKILNRVYEFREDIRLLLGNQTKFSEKELSPKIKDIILSVLHNLDKLAYLADVFSEFNVMNYLLQGNMMNVLTAQDKIASFLRKLELYQRRVQAGDVSVFTQLNEHLINAEQKNISVVNSAAQNLSSVIDLLKQYFPDLENRKSNSWILRPFSTNDNIFKDSDVAAKVEFIGLQENSTMKIDFQNCEPCTFWRKAASEYPIIADRALKMLIQFANSSKCESDGFSALGRIITTKAECSHLNVEHYMRCALSVTKPNIPKLANVEEPKH